MEESLDVEWANSIAPQANIILFEANGATTSGLFTAVKTAADYSGVSVVSMSWGMSEAIVTGEASLDSAFETPSGHTPVTFLASTGDSSAPGEYPAYSPNVIAVGGTTLTINASGAWQSETAWGDGVPGDEGGGGGESIYEKEPSYQDAVQSSGQREIPDVSFDANPDTGVAVCDSYDFPGEAWLQVGGTSLACPSWAGLISIADQYHAASGLTLLSSSSNEGYSLQTLLYTEYSLSSPYSHGAFHDITSGSNGYPATAGYNMVGGIGSPIANVVVPLLADQPPTITSVSANPSPVTSGTTSTLTVVASDFAGLTLTYTWSTVFSPGGVQRASYSAAGTVTATGDNTLVTFYGTGQYEFAVKVTDSFGLSASSGPLTVVVEASEAGITVTRRTRWSASGSSSSLRRSRRTSLATRWPRNRRSPGLRPWARSARRAFSRPPRRPPTAR